MRNENGRLPAKSIERKEPEERLNVGEIVRKMPRNL